jgi:hypothetical protein
MTERERGDRNARTYIQVTELAERQARRNVAAASKPIPPKVAKRLREESRGLRSARHSN